MSNRLLSAIVSICLSAAVGIGVWQFPHSLDPVGGAVAGTTLNDLVRSTATMANDWFVISPGATVTTTPSGLRLVAPRGPEVLEAATVSVPVFAHTCYRLEIDASVRRGGTTGAIFDENWLHKLFHFTLPVARAATFRGTFSTGANERISILVYGEDRSDVTLRRTRVVRAGNTCR